MGFSGVMYGLRLSPWMTRREAAEYLRWKVNELDARLVQLSAHPEPVKGKMRYLLMEVEAALCVRILSADVFFILPLPPGLQDYGSTGPRDNRTTGPQDYG